MDRVVAQDPAKLRMLGRLADIGLATATLVHEMRQPLAGIKAFGQLIEVDPSSAPSLARDIVAQAVVLETLLERIRAYLGQSSAPAAGALTDVTKAIDGTLALVAGTIHATGARLERSEDPDLPAARIASSSFQQIVLNLVRNAAEASPRGHIHVRVRRKPGAIVVEVADDGPGVRDRSKIFQPLETTKPDGMGLGLYVSRSLAEEVGGNLELAPAGAAPGACFVLTIPAG